jgi:hypothetical protein
MATIKTVLVAFSLLVLSAAQAQSTTVFRGRPSVKISEGGVERLPETLSREKAINLECVISQIGDDFYWASRENVPMVPSESGAFITYIAVNGAGYKPDLKEVAAIMGETEAKFDYVEHITLGLKSVTYYGKARP